MQHAVRDHEQPRIQNYQGLFPLTSQRFFCVLLKGPSNKVSAKHLKGLITKWFLLETLNYWRTLLHKKHF